MPDFENYILPPEKIEILKQECAKREAEVKVSASWSGLFRLLDSYDRIIRISNTTGQIASEYTPRQVKERIIGLLKARDPFVDIHLVTTAYGIQEVVEKFLIEAITSGKDLGIIANRLKSTLK